MDYTWVRELRKPVTFYTAMASSELLDHFQALCDSLRDLDVLELQN